jgi:hypothetical protein
MYRYLIIDGCLSGTGIRDYYEGGYIEPSVLMLSQDTVQRLEAWLEGYRNEHYNGFSNKEKVQELDNEGKNIAVLVKDELRASKIQYYSAATLQKEDI